MTSIDLTALSPEQKAALAKQLADEKKAEKEQRAIDLKALEELAAEALPKSMEKLKEASRVMAEAKAEVFNHFSDYLKMKIATIGIKSNQKSHTITYGNQKVILGYRVSDGYTDDANYGVALVHKFIESCAKDANSKNLVKWILRLLQKNAKGDLDSKNILKLQQMANDFPDSDLEKGVEIITNAFKEKMSKWFIECYESDNQGIEKSVPLSVTSVDLPQDFDLSFLLPTEQDAQRD